MTPVPEPRPIRGARGTPPRIETSAGGVVVRWIDGAPHVLLIRDAHRQWGFPKGHLEPGETADVAALREVREETGLAELRLRVRLQTIDWIFRSRGQRIHKYCHFFLIESPTGEPVPEHAEGITACCWLPLAEALGRISYANAREVLERAAEELNSEKSEV